MDRLSARILAAMGLASVGCPAGEPPPKTSTVAAPADASVATPIPIDVPDAGSPSVAASVTPPTMPTPVFLDAGRPIADAGRADAGRDAGAAIAAYEISYPLPANQVQWCTKMGQAMCLDGPSAAFPPSNRPFPPSTRFPSCPSQREVACACHSQMGCNDMPGDSKCSERLDETLTAQQQARHPGACCYPHEVYCGHPGEGRPLRVSDGMVVAEATRRDDWVARPMAVSIDVPKRNELTDHWTRVASAEHASIAAFARTSLELLALGAPPTLIAGAHGAALDELGHAQVSYALASAYSGSIVGPGSLALPATRDVSTMGLALETLVDGCFGETVGAVLLGLVADRVDPAARDALRRIAEEETRHAELAFAILAWLVRGASDADRAALRHAAARATVHVEATAYFSESEARAVADDVIAKVVRPCLDRLLTCPAMS